MVRSAVSEETKQRAYSPHRIVVVTAICLVFVAGVTACWSPAENPTVVDSQEVADSPAATLLPAAATGTPPLEAIARPTIGLATPWEVAGGAAYSPDPSDAIIATPLPIIVQGPPSASLFRSSDEISFLWTWPRELEEGDRFVIYLTTNGERSPVGVVTDMNLGMGYQIQTILGEIVGKPGTYGWQVVLESLDGEVIIAQSEVRPITLMEG
jgi:hypothetical protein